METSQNFSETCPLMLTGPFPLRNGNWSVQVTHRPGTRQRCRWPVHHHLTGALMKFAWGHFNPSPGQNGHHFTDNIFKCILINRSSYILIWISLKFDFNSPIDIKSALVQVWYNIFTPLYSHPGVKISYNIFTPWWKYRYDIFTPLTIFSPPSQ